MATGSPGPPQRPVFSPDGFWWWDGAQWRPAISPDRLWRWNGQAWEPNRPAAAPRSGGATAAIVVVVAFVGVVVLVSIFAIVVLLTMGNQIANVFSNVAAALGSPSP